MQATANQTGGRNSAFTVKQMGEAANSLPMLIDCTTLASLMGVSVRHIQRMASTGQIPCVRIGSSYRFNTAKMLEMCGYGEAMPCDR